MKIVPSKACWLLCVIILSVLGCDDSLTFDSKGVAHGSGERTYNYRSGGVRLREEYVGGKLVRSRWFKPDGTLLQETKWVDGTGEGIYLREDGSIRRRMRYVKGVAEGEAYEYDETGNLTKVMHYREGKPIGESEPAATRPNP